MRHFVWLMLPLALLPARAGTAETGTLHVTVREPGRREPLACRAWVDAPDGERLYQPTSEGCTPYRKDRSFSCDGKFTMKIEAGPAVVHVERGKEYFLVDRAVEIREGRTTDVEIPLRRWVNMTRRGWYSGDFHVHFGKGHRRVLRQLALADDVNFLPVFAYWNEYHRQWPAWARQGAIRADETHWVSLRNMEIERIGGADFASTGALLMFGLTEPVFAQEVSRTYPCDATFGQSAKRASPACVIDTDKPLWGENVVGAALGLFDSVQICHNHYHRAGSIPKCCGMIGTEIEDRRRSWDDWELFHRTNEIYYRWLNCGFRLAVTAGSAMGVMPVPPGYSRTYAKLDGPLTEASYLAAVRAGRTFATSGPMLFLTVDGKGVGSSIARASADTEPLRVQASLESIQAIDRLEVIHNGVVIRSVPLEGETPDPVLKRSAQVELRPARSGWVVARAIFESPPGHLREAHTSPVYVIVDDKPIASKADAGYMIRWIDKLLEIAASPKRYESNEQREDVLSIYRQARGVYETIAQTAETVWGD